MSLTFLKKKNFACTNYLLSWRKAVSNLKENLKQLALNVPIEKSRPIGVVHIALAPTI